MADVTKLAARRKGFGAPPSLDEASSNLSAPETAPAAPAGVEQPNSEAPAATPAKAQAPAAKARTAPAPRAKAAAAEPLQVLPPPAVATRIDGRSLRRTNRTQTLATRVTPEFDARVRAIAQREGIMLVEVLERALDALEESK